MKEQKIEENSPTYNVGLANYIKSEFSFHVPLTEFLNQVIQHSPQLFSFCTTQEFKKKMEILSEQQVKDQLLYKLSSKNGWFDIVIKILNTKEICSEFVADKLLKLKEEFDQRLKKGEIQSQHYNSSSDDDNMPTTSKGKGKRLSANGNTDKETLRKKPKYNMPTTSKGKGKRLSANGNTDKETLRKKTNNMPTTSKGKGKRLSANGNTDKETSRKNQVSGKY
ncbi:uncharacterized protein LOC131938693 [Physella acuta]|uniref:uncharacterized protein LOC131938693 n=1 Tax=Physella acuta TaxID=109671 RepID=UPI0027DAE4D2|nr:uncharacterized protein LOC131938693 [Physella acuta]